MNIEILGVGFTNKGAQLMLIAVVEELARSCPGARLAIRTKHLKNWDPGELNVFQKPSISESLLGDLVLRIRFNKKARKYHHMILDPEIDAVLDASGFKYSDFFGHTSIHRRGKRIRKWNKAGKRIVLLPQAFGPLKVPRVRKAIQNIAENVDLMFPRDRESYDYVSSVVGERSNIRICPDFTNLVKGTRPDYFTVNKPRACLIPNAQMIAKTADMIGESYIPFMSKCARFLKGADLDPFILLHAKGDRPLAQKIQKMANMNLDVIEEADPVKLKGIIGSCYLVVGSRFHALTSALSQGVPAVAVGWSHKYEQLFDEYGCNELLISNLDFNVEALQKLQMLISPANHERVVLTLEQSAKVEVQKVEQMWRDVIEVISR